MIECSSGSARESTLSKSPIRIDLRSARGLRQALDEAPALSVWITNVSREPVWMVGVLPGSDGLRYPRYLIEIEAPTGPLQISLPEELDYARGLRAEDFVPLAPGEGFDPQGKGFIPIQKLAWFKPAEPGRYSLRLCFDATAEDPREWMGHTQVHDREKLEMLIRRVPAVKVWSETLEIEFY